MDTAKSTAEILHALTNPDPQTLAEISSGRENICRRTLRQTNTPMLQRWPAHARTRDRARLRSGAYVQVAEVTSEKGRAADATAVGRVRAQSNRCAEEAARL